MILKVEVGWWQNGVRVYSACLQANCEDRADKLAGILWITKVDSNRASRVKGPGECQV